MMYRPTRERIKGMKKSIWLAAAAIAISACSNETPPEPGAAPAAPAKAVLDLMVNDITQASGTLWDADDPRTNDEWLSLDAAALVLIERFETIRKGGAGPNDNSWAADANYQAYIDTEIAAAQLAREAIAAHDIDALFDAGNELYTPCEECHLEFNPAVQGQ